MCESSYTTHINTTLLYKQYSHYHHYTYHYSALQVPEGLALFDLLQLPPAGILKVLYLTSQLLRGVLKKIPFFGKRFFGWIQGESGGVSGGVSVTVVSVIIVITFVTTTITITITNANTHFTTTITTATTTATAPIQTLLSQSNVRYIDIVKNNKWWVYVALKSKMMISSKNDAKNNKLSSLQYVY